MREVHGIVDAIADPGDRSTGDRLPVRVYDNPDRMIGLRVATCCVSLTIEQAQMIKKCLNAAVGRACKRDGVQATGGSGGRASK